MAYPLFPHPDCSGAPACKAAVEAERSRSLLKLIFQLEGPIDQVRLPAKAAAMRADELWKETCFEVFLADGDGPYLEVNLSPSDQWAAYVFTRYRVGMRSAPIAPPVIHQQRTPDRLQLSANLDLTGIEMLSPRRPWRAGFSAVLQSRDLRLSYWALTHPGAAPDFHHPESFTAKLEAAS